MGAGAKLVGGAMVVAIVAGAGYVTRDRWLPLVGVKPVAPQQAAAPAAPKGPQMGIPVRAEKVTLLDFVPVIPATGSLRANESVTIAPEISGRLSEFRAKEGQPIKKGDVIALLDTTVLEAELAQARAGLALARANASRANELAARNFGTQRSRDEALAELRTTEAAIATAEARLQRSKLVAPFDGVLGLRNISSGDFVNAGSALITLEQVDPLKMDFRVPETQLSRIAVGQTVDVEVDALPGRKFTGTVYAIDASVEPGGRSLLVRATLPNPERTLKPGLFARIQINLAVRKDTIMIPEEAVVPSPQGAIVMSVVDGKAQIVPVKLGDRRNSQVEVIKPTPLTADSVIITQGQTKVFMTGGNGAPVTVLPPPGTAPPGAAPAAAPKKEGAPS
ncbi:efflux RND transporter periplasmic adaptor subunit [Lacibacterium aquatile]|uniref:Efflux RND transporter periplasmic adaptor subunit n=1 Tax=Lacibacterium aquatile TaxID=1168082 RepID=A0ABW5DXJ3_9PROT